MIYALPPSPPLAHELGEASLVESLGLLPAFANLLEERVARVMETSTVTPTAEWSAVRAR